MATKRLAFASILIGLFMALSLMPGLAFAAADGSNAQGEELQIQPQATNGATSQANQANGDEIAPATEPKPSQAIQASHMSVFVSDASKNLNAKVVEGKGALSYAVKSGDDCVSVDSNGALTFRKAGTAIITVTAAETGPMRKRPWTCPSRSTITSITPSL